MPFTIFEWTLGMNKNRSNSPIKHSFHKILAKYSLTCHLHTYICFFSFAAELERCGANAWNRRADIWWQDSSPASMHRVSTCFLELDFERQYIRELIRGFFQSWRFCFKDNGGFTCASHRSGENGARGRKSCRHHCNIYDWRKDAYHLWWRDT